MSARLLVLSFAVGLAACAPPCETSCGLISDTQRCEELQTQELRALESFSSGVEHWAVPWTCSRIQDFQVRVDPDTDGAQFLLERNGAFVLGYADCIAKEIVTANEDWARNAFTHELAHAIEGCVGPPILPVWHYGWEIRRINAAVNNVTLN